MTSKPSFQFQCHARISACADKVFALEIFKKMQQEEGKETLADEGTFFNLKALAFPP